MACVKAKQKCGGLDEAKVEKVEIPAGPMVTDVLGALVGVLHRIRYDLRNIKASIDNRWGGADDEDWEVFSSSGEEEEEAEEVFEELVGLSEDAVTGRLASGPPEGGSSHLP